MPHDRDAGVYLRLLAAAAMLVAAAGIAACARAPSGGAPEGAAVTPTAGAGVKSGDEILARAYEDRLDELQVKGQGVVVRLLADDDEGARHQRFILRLASGQTLLIAHNIDVAPRVEGVRVGDTVAFKGVYEWSEEGGTVHWTHRDPEGEHEAGWLLHDDRVYQ